MTSEIVFEYSQYEFENVEELSQMFELCFGYKPNPGYFQWKYLDNPAGKAIAFVAKHEGTIAGFYGVIPEWYWIADEKQTIYQSMDTMTHPDYQRKGLFGKLAKLTYEHIKQVNGSIHLIGFPGHTSYNGFVNRLDWEDIIQIKYRFVYRFWFGLRHLFTKFPPIKIVTTDRLDQDVSVYLDTKKNRALPIEKYIDGSILQWRILDHPIRKYKLAKILVHAQLVGIVAYEMMDNKLFILNLDVDVEILNSSHLGSLCNELLKIEKQANALYTFQPNQSSLDQAYKNNGFAVNPFKRGPFSYRTPFIVYGDKQINGIDWFDASNFNIQPVFRDF
ncbi:MAG: GNAT family N-acetyltransferase [Reichenbachiella sp.]|uniref:GNAT family N-acetyltransferase n=1 Tax=Reichenbachiella sp. TaxID=2184521 RepID=UPI00326346B6